MKKLTFTFEVSGPKQPSGMPYNLCIKIPGIKDTFALLESDRPEAVDFTKEKAKVLMHELATCPPALIQHRLGYLRAYLKQVDEKPNSRPVQKLFKIRFQQLCKPPEK